MAQESRLELAEAAELEPEPEAELELEPASQSYYLKALPEYL